MIRQRKPAAVPSPSGADAVAAASVPVARSAALLDLWDWLLLLVFTLLSFSTKFYKLEEPKVVLFDEVHFGKFVNAHLTGRFYFDIHPPLVKLLMAGLLRLVSDYNGDQPFETIGEKYLATTPVWWFRFIPALSGSLIVPVTFLITRRLRFSKWVSVLCSSMICFDNLILGESREILTDTSLILFVCLALLFHLSAEQQRLHSVWWYVYTVLTGVSLGGAITTKWTSLSVFGIVGLSTVVDLYLRFERFPSKKLRSAHARDFVVRGVLLLGIPCLIYVTSFVLYFQSLPASGDGDAFMPIPFRASLQNSKINWQGPVPSFNDNFWALNIEMFRANKNINTPHHWQSYWYTWPLNLRGIACWNGERVLERQADGSDVIKQPFVYLLGNPFVWWFSTLCLIASPWVLATLRTSNDWPPHQHHTHSSSSASASASSSTRPASSKVRPHSAQHHQLEAFDMPTSAFPDRFSYLMFQLYTGWVASILPYALISRACFIYHYMPALVFAVLISGVLFDVWFAARGTAWTRKLVLIGGLVASFVWAFWFFVPLSYGDALTDEENFQRRWIDGWN